LPDDFLVTKSSVRQIANLDYSQTNGEILQSAQSKAVADVLAAALLRLRHRQELSFIKQIFVFHLFFMNNSGCTY